MPINPIFTLLLFSSKSPIFSLDLPAMSCDDDPELFLDKNWRTITKKHHQHYTFEQPSQNPNSSSSSKTASFRKHSSKPSLSKSSSVRIPHHATTSSSASLRRSSSTTHARSPENSPPPKGSSFTRKCTSLAREQKARFYIMRRCVSMLVRWSKHRDSES